MAKTKEDMMNDQITKSKRTEESRKRLQQENWEDYERNLKTIKEDIKENEGYDIQEEMLTQRRDWIREEMRRNGMKPPKDLSNFYKQQEVQKPMSANEEALKKLQEEEDEKAKKKAKKDKGKKGKAKKKKKGDDDDKPDIVLTGPSEVV